MNGHITARSVIALAGRRIDAPDSSSPRFPLAMTERVHSRLRKLMLGRNAAALVSSAACGADLIALDLAAQLGLRRRIVLPLPADRFRNLSVVDRPGDWGPLFDACIGDVRAAGDLVVLDAPSAIIDDAFAAANTRILQEAEALAGSLQVVAVLVWEGAPRGADDHTAAFGRLAQQRGLDIVEVATHD